MPAAANLAKASLGGLFAAMIIATPVVIDNEGWVLKTYADPVGIPTACAGVTGGVQAGRTYTEAQCEDMTARALLEHAIAVRPCLPENLPTKTRAAFVSFAYNVGAAKACGSGAYRKARAGDLPGACAELSRWVYAGGLKLPGLVKRRLAERALCESGLT